ncbi:MAG: type II secretion system protein [Verrucomicrobiia bacterium]
MKNSSKRAFTLTELLVIVPIAGLLATLLFAVSKDAVQQAQAATCLNNMRQWGLGFMLYANDWRDYFPYDGVCGGNASLCDRINTDAWFNVVPPYIGRKPLCQLYATGAPPKPLTGSIWSCPSSTNHVVQPTPSNPYFMYSMSSCWHTAWRNDFLFRRKQAISPANTILFCEQPENPFSITNGKYDTVTRHFGGSNFVFADGHADWLTFTNFCREGNPVGCPAPLGDIPWDDAEGGDGHGDWNPIVKYHWWPFVDADATVPRGHALPL